MMIDLLTTFSSKSQDLIKKVWKGTAVFIDYTYFNWLGDLDWISSVQGQVKQSHKSPQLFCQNREILNQGGNIYVP